MPGSMDGLKLARAIRDRWPPIELILTSGHFDVPEGGIPERGLFFSKPYHDNEIVSALQRFASYHRQLFLFDSCDGSRFRSLVRSRDLSSEWSCAEALICIPSPRVLCFSAKALFISGPPASPYGSCALTTCQHLSRFPSASSSRHRMTVGI
jgi:hypothetical protein